MLHIVKRIQRRNPEHASSIIKAVALGSGSALLLGAGLLLLR